MDLNVGLIYGDMKIVEFIKKDKNFHTHYRVRCGICKREKITKLYVLKQGKGINHSSCGKGLKTLDKEFYTHWSNMRTRTTNVNYDHYKDYGGRGISSEAYKDFIDFYDDLYKSYLIHSKLHGSNNTTLERKDVNDDYKPSNTTWATWEEQLGNTRKNRFFKATSPEDIVYTSNNQCKFAREHNLSDKQINGCLSGRFHTHLGWKFEYIIKCND